MGLSVLGQVLRAHLQMALAKDAGQRLMLDLVEVLNSLPPGQRAEARRILMAAASGEVTHA